MENKTYVVAEVGYEALFEAMVAQAEADIAKAKADAQVAIAMMQSVPFDANTYAKGKSKMDNALRLQRDAKDGLAEWLKVLKVLDIADAVIG